MSLKTTLFPVKEIPAVGYPLDDNQDVTLLDKTGYKFIVREDTNEVLSCMSNEYKLIKNQEIIEKAMPVIEDRGGVMVEQNLFGNGSRASWQWKFPEIEVDIGGGDLMNPTINISNSYDGSSEASAIAGAFRLICSNGLIIGITLGKGSTRHSIWSKKNNFEEIISSVINSVENIFKTDFKDLINTEIDKKHIAKLIKLFPETHTESLLHYILAHKPKTYWDLLNAATWVATHQMKREVEATHKFESKLYSTVHGFAKSVIAKA
tara:strand:+ start:1721 stop:2512 length:792 start_codon:yes stop_codon:yes gene_type:complete